LTKRLLYDILVLVTVTNTIGKEVDKMTAKIGRQAPDFKANAYVRGEIKEINLSDYRGQWVVLCFYPGDFTFV